MQQDQAGARVGDGDYAVGRSRRGRDATPTMWSSCRHCGAVVRSRFMVEVAAVSVLVGDGVARGVRDGVGGGSVGRGREIYSERINYSAY